ncbi:MAG: TrkA family potassium uptake protein [Thermoplasmata archaeon]|nr:TrkA family potassium uptake protein [Thermoplasmata archaeon]
MGEEWVAIDLVSERVPEGTPLVIGDAGREEVLKNAGVEKARALIATTKSDATNALIVLMAKSINPTLMALAVVKRVASIDKLYKAQADYVVSDAMMGGRLVAKNAVSPYIGDFIESITLSRNVEITEMMIPSNSDMIGNAIQNSGIREHTRVNIIGLKRDNKMTTTPRSSTILKARDKLIVIGDTKGIKALSKMLRGQ